MPDTFQPVARVSDIPRKQTRSFGVGDSRILIAHTSDGFFALADACTHADSRLSHGRLRGCRIVCPLHGAAFDVRDGRVLKGPATRPVPSYPLRVVDDRLEVSLP